MKILKLTKANHPEVLALFGDKAKYYYFIIDDLLRNNYEGEHFHVFGEYENGEMVSLLLNNFNNVTYFSPFDRSVDIFKDILDNLTFTKLSGPSELMGKFLPFISMKKDTMSYLGVVESLFMKPSTSVKFIRSDVEIGMQYDLLMSTGEFVNSLPKAINDYIASESVRLNNSTDRTAYISIDGTMVSSCATIREGENSAIIIGVVTHPKYRNKGYGSQVLIGLFDELLREGKYPYLFYNNPAARSVYLTIGTTEVCEWRVIEVREIMKSVTDKQVKLEAQRIIKQVDEIYYRHSREWFIGLIAHGSAVKGGFIPGSSDIDFMLYLEDSALNASNTLPLEIAVSIHRELSQIDIKPFRYIQFRVVTPSTNHYSGLVPGTYQLIRGKILTEEATNEQLYNNALKELGSLDPGTIFNPHSLLDHGEGRIERCARGLSTVIWPTLFQVLTLMHKDGIRIWNLTKHQAIDLMPVDSALGEKIRAFYISLVNYYPEENSVEYALAVITNGIAFLTEARNWYEQSI